MKKGMKTRKIRLSQKIIKGRRTLQFFYLVMAQIFFYVSLQSCVIYSTMVCKEIRKMKKILLVTMCAALMVTATPLEGMKGSIISAVDLARGAANVSVAAAGTVGLFVVAGLVTYTFWGCTVW